MRVMTHIENTSFYSHKQGGVLATHRSARGLARMAAIIEAAVVVFARDGVDRATTNAIAAQAGISPGSLYQYFNDRTDILKAVVRDYISRLAEVYQAVWPTINATTPRPEMIAALLVPLAEFKRANATFAMVYAHPNLPAELRQEVDGVNQAFTTRLVALLAARNPATPRETLELAARQAACLFRGSLPLLGSVTGDEQRDTQELCTVIDAYLASREIS
ncbi:TetR/AcrR family transcriptional regulator [Buchananella hordeovulneris]|nr:TetR/AcrR family transcriptional regulator [Buchananella hordeovulneris]